MRRFLPLGLVLLLVTGCASTTPAQRIAIFCNPVALAVGIAWELSPFGPPLLDSANDCAQAIKDKVEEAKSETATPRTSPEPPAVQDTSARGCIAE